jgi:hypothetical protein
VVYRYHAVMHIKARVLCESFTFLCRRGFEGSNLKKHRHLLPDLFIVLVVIGYFMMIPCREGASLGSPLPSPLRTFPCALAPSFLMYLVLAKFKVLNDVLLHYVLALFRIIPFSRLLCISQLRESIS